MSTSQLLILGTGGTIAGAAPSSSDHVGYRAGSLRLDQLLSGVPELAQEPLAFEQLAQLDSKDMDFATWYRLAERVQRAQDDPDVLGVVITHGTDTLEETAYLLHRVLKGSKPVVLTAAMRPATSRSPDGPQNLLDAVTLARTPGATGVLVVVQGAAHRADRVRKVHSYRVDAFASPEGGPVAWIENGAVRAVAAWAQTDGLGVERLAAARWPRVELLWNAAGADGAVVPLLQRLAADEGRKLGLVVAGTGNGTLSVPLEAVLRKAQGEGVAVLRCTRCAAGPVIGGELPSAGALSAPQARVELLLRLLG
jgi:L-asparaginase